VAIYFKISNTTMLFVNAHLSAHQSEELRRNAEFHRIDRMIPLQLEKREPSVVAASQKIVVERQQLMRDRLEGEAAAARRAAKQHMIHSDRDFDVADGEGVQSLNEDQTDSVMATVRGGVHHQSTTMMISPSGDSINLSTHTPQSSTDATNSVPNRYHVTIKSIDPSKVVAASGSADLPVVEGLSTETDLQSPTSSESIVLLCNDNDTDGAVLESKDTVNSQLQRQLSLPPTIKIASPNVAASSILKASPVNAEAHMRRPSRPTSDPQLDDGSTDAEPPLPISASPNKEQDADSTGKKLPLEDHLQVEEEHPPVDYDSAQLLPSIEDLLAIDPSAKKTLDQTGDFVVFMGDLNYRIKGNR
jgi:hypothetical protein